MKITGMPHHSGSVGCHIRLNKLSNIECIFQNIPILGMVLTFYISLCGMVILLQDGINVGNFGSHCRSTPTGQRNPCYFFFKEAFKVVCETSREEDGPFGPSLTALADEIETAYIQTFRLLIDSHPNVQACTRGPCKPQRSPDI